MHFLCLQSMLASIVPCDLGLVGIPAFAWVRDALTWVRRVAFAGGARAVIAGAILLAPGRLAFLQSARSIRRTASIQRDGKRNAVAEFAEGSPTSSFHPSEHPVP